MGIKDKLPAGVRKQAKQGANFFGNSPGGPTLTSDDKKKKSNESSKSRSAWDQWRSMTTSEKSATQDIHNTQNFERGEIGEVKGKALPETLAAVIGVLVFVLVWLLCGIFGYAWNATGLGGNFGALGSTSGNASSTSPGGGVDAQAGAGANGTVHLEPGSKESEMYAKYAEAPIWAGSHPEWDEYGKSLGVPPYYEAQQESVGSVSVDCYVPLSPDGSIAGDCMSRLHEPDWHKQAMLSAMGVYGDESYVNSTGEGASAQGGVDPNGNVDVDGDVAPGNIDGDVDGAQGDKGATDSLGSWLLFAHAGWFRWLISLIVGVIAWAVARKALMLQLSAQNLMYDNKDINQYHNDQHIALVEEIVAKYQVFPDVGAHSEVQPSSMLSHVMLLNKGVKSIEMAKRAEADILDEDGNVEVYKGEVLYDDDGNPELYETEMFDHEFAHDLFDKSGLERVKRLRRFLDAREAPSNPGGKIFGKLKAETVADHINEYWTFPYYEPQRPAGAYIVDEAPVNTMILAMTRAGKGNAVPAC